MKIAASVAIVTLSWVAACAAPETPPVQACTMIGCSDGLAVEVNSNVQQAITVNVRTGNTVIHTFRCEAGQPCRAFVEQQTPAEVTIVIDAPSGRVARSYQPEYRINKPNGPDCPPDCRQATVNVNLS